AVCVPATGFPPGQPARRRGGPERPVRRSAHATGCRHPGLGLGPGCAGVAVVEGRLMPPNEHLTLGEQVLLARGRTTPWQLFPDAAQLAHRVPFMMSWYFGIGGLGTTLAASAVAQPAINVVPLDASFTAIM